MPKSLATSLNAARGGLLAVSAVLALGACAQDQGGRSAEPAGAPAAARQPAIAFSPAEVRIVGTLTLKGPSQFAWWAVTDGAGKVWKLSSVTAEQGAFLERSQNHRIALTGRLDGKYLNLDQVVPLKIEPQ